MQFSLPSNNPDAISRMQKVSDSEARAAINDSPDLAPCDVDMSDFAEYGNGRVLPPPKSTTTSRPQRQKSKHACESCKLRKRKCDGNQPCYMCERYEYDCHYAAQSRRKRSRPDERVEPERNGSLEREQLQPKSPPSVSAIAEPQAESLPFLEANSALRFAQVVRSVSILMNDQAVFTTTPGILVFGWSQKTRKVHCEHHKQTRNATTG